jgi:hypothetical protein
MRFVGRPAGMAYMVKLQGTAMAGATATVKWINFAGAAHR